MTNSTAARVLEALGGNEHWVRVYEALYKRGDTKAMSGMRRFLKSYSREAQWCWGCRHSEAAGRLGEGEGASVVKGWRKKDP